MVIVTVQRLPLLHYQRFYGRHARMDSRWQTASSHQQLRSMNHAYGREIHHHRRSFRFEYCGHVTRAAFAEFSAEEERDIRLREYTDALILSFFACKAQSLFALNCVVETVVVMYQLGCTVSELQVLLAMKPFECGAAVVTDAEQDVLLSWSALIMLTLYRIGIQHGKCRTVVDVVGDGALQMTSFVQQFLAMCSSGVSVDELLQTQIEAAKEKEMTPASKMMQLNSMLVMTTISKKQEITEPGEDKGDAQRFVSSFDEALGCQELALKALVAFMGASRGSVFCIDRFVSAVTRAYEYGLAAKEIVASITEEQYEEACRLLPVLDAETQGVAGGISRQLFGRCIYLCPYSCRFASVCRWVSIVFMTLAESGFSHQLSTKAVGWAWAFDNIDDEQASEMTDLANFVGNSLRKVTSDDADTTIDLSDRLQGVPDMLEYLPKYKEEAEKERVQKYGTSWVTVEDDQMQQTSPTVLAFWQMIFLVHLTYRKHMAAIETQNTRTSNP